MAERELRFLALNHCCTLYVSCESLAFFFMVLVHKMVYCCIAAIDSIRCDLITARRCRRTGKGYPLLGILFLYEYLNTIRLSRCFVLVAGDGIDAARKVKVGSV